MKKNLYIILLVAATTTLYAQVDRSKIPGPGPAREIKIGDYESFTLKNGLKVFVVENHKLPRVSFSIVFDRQPVFEGDKAGFLGMVGPMLRRGTSSRTKDQIDEEIDFIGATLSASSSSVYGSSLTKHKQKLLELMTDVMFHPTFPKEELEKIKTQTLSGLAANKDDPDAISSNVSTAWYMARIIPMANSLLKKRLRTSPLMILKIITKRILSQISPIWQSLEISKRRKP